MGGSGLPKAWGPLLYCRADMGSVKLCLHGQSSSSSSQQFSVKQASLTLNFLEFNVLIQFQSWRIMCVPVVLKTWFPRTSSFTWELKHLKAWAHSRPTQSETLEVGSSHLYLTSPLGVYNVDTYICEPTVLVVFFQNCYFIKHLAQLMFPTTRNVTGACVCVMKVCESIAVCGEVFLEVSLIIDLFKYHLQLKTTWVSS